MRQLLSDSYAPGDMLHLDLVFCMIMLISEIYNVSNPNQRRQLLFVHVLISL